MNFKPFHMAQISAQLQHKCQSPSGTCVNLHSSNPEPFTWDELHDLIGSDPLAVMNQAQLGYASTQGAASLRTLIAEQYHDETLHADDVVLTSGAQEGIFVTMQALLKPGDGVIGFTPCFEPLSAVAEQVGATVTLIPLDANNNWQINWQQLENAISAETKLLVVNFPHNPTGSHITASELQRLIGLCEANDCWLFSDEVFRGLEHQVDHQLTAAADLYSKAISMGVMSKSMALPGIRLGWLSLQDSKLKQNMLTIKSHLSICQSAVDTQLCEAIIPFSKRIWHRNRNIIKQNKKWLQQRLKDHPELHWQIPQAAATGFVQLKSQKSTQMAEYCAKHLGVMVMPNQAFMTTHSGFRLTLGVRDAEKYAALTTPLLERHLGD